MTPVDTIKIFGERNTCTTALRHLITQNSGTRIAPSVAAALEPRAEEHIAYLMKLPKGRLLREIYSDAVFEGVRPLHAWKHAAANFDSAGDFRGAAVLFMVRHPASWLLAFHRRPYQYVEPVPAKLSDFLGFGWKTTAREHLGERVFTPGALYEAKVASYLAFAETLRAAGIPHAVLRFEDVCVDQLAVFEQIQPLLRAPAGAPAPVRESTNDPGKDWRYYADRYANARWLAEIDPQSRRIMNSTLNWAMFARFGYKPLPLDGSPP